MARKSPSRSPEKLYLHPKVHPRDFPVARYPRDFPASRKPRAYPASRYAWVTLVMCGDGYAAGALAVAHSLRRVETRHDLVYMVTPDVTHSTYRHLCVVYDHVIEVQYIQHPCRRLKSEKQQRMYNDWIESSFTKWNCLKLDYERVLFIDADMIVKENSDDLFELQPPASIFAIPNARPWGDLPNVYLTRSGNPPKHGELISPDLVKRAVRSNSFVACGAMVLLQPDLKDFNDLCKFIKKDAVFGDGLKTTSGADEISISLFYANAGVSWTNIHRRYSVIAWKRDWAMPSKLYILHIFGRPKPWEKGCAWPDPDWWGVVDDLLRLHPDLSKLYPSRPAVTTNNDMLGY
ncbi:predicted protein [Nematostella vectensis]|uniref:glycogenin glucosyltransferase n=1 Tax=Nematostella vectensis TaxID=45351 RepID=A7S5W4_NEMVE|nr:predicted protein [Nematostella vectensis]|eukprot:XP_001632896.1 predicted protein [Nematostella vectensis]